jgi:hypothetical protein
MKKMFGIVVVLLFFYIAFQVAYSYMTVKQVNKYKLIIDNSEYQVTETFTNGHKNKDLSVNEESNYYYEITKDSKLLFSFKLIGNYIGKKEILKDLILYNDGNLMCAYPLFKDKVENIDVLCNTGDKYYLYGSLKGKYISLDNFVASLKLKGYSHPSWDNINLETRSVDNFSIYFNNITDDMNISLWQYKGFYKITSEGEKLLTLVNSDQYEPILTTMVNQYYVIPDYKLPHQFERFFITNFLSGDMDTFELGMSISYNSFIQGVVNNKIYLIDRDKKTQYSIDIYRHEVKLVGDVDNSTKYYSNGKWSQKSIYDAIDNNLTFEMINTIPDNLKVMNLYLTGEVGGETDGYYYLYMKEDNNVNVYRVDKQNTNIMTLLFSVPSVNNIKYVNKDIYLISNDTLYVYRDSFGLRPLIKYNEFVFNKSNLYNVYVEK